MAALMTSAFNLLLLHHVATLVSFGIAFRVPGVANRRGTHEGFAYVGNAFPSSILNKGGGEMFSLSPFSAAAFVSCAW